MGAKKSWNRNLISKKQAGTLCMYRSTDLILLAFKKIFIWWPKPFKHPGRTEEFWTGLLVLF
jgi:hypothetical protein